MKQRGHWKPVKNQKGQITIFIVLVFQVLFVFFAMVTNIGLVVHEKINVQNAADLAAIYGAQKQAEVLNAIAHTNYQIRQAWKLLAFRIRVLGDFGRQGEGGHPIRPLLASGSAAINGGVTNAWSGSAVSGSVPSGGNIKPPMVCVNHGGWATSSGSTSYTNTNAQNICKSSGAQVGVTIPQLPNIQIFFPLVDNLVRSQFNDLQEQIDDSCNGAGESNWRAAAAFMALFKLDMRNKFLKMRRLKGLLEQGLDLEGQSINEGVRRTFEGNLTGGRGSGVSIRWINSLQLPGFNSNWLNVKYVFPLVYFVGQVGTSGCTGKISSLFQAYSDPGAINSTATSSFFSSTLDSQLRDLSVDSNAPTIPWSDESLFRSSLGVEKNPWIAVYSGVEASVTAAKPFMPILNGHQVTAKSFAMPFGASVGPWTTDRWPPGSFKSIGGNTIDPLLPDAWDGAGAPGGLSTRNIPNYARFPGDTVGIGSTYSLQEMAKVWPRAGANFGRVSLVAYLQRLPWAANAENVGQVAVGGLTQMEGMAVAPDLFDLAYYTIDPNAFAYFNQRSGSPRNNLVPDYTTVQGSTRNNIQEQIQTAISSGLNAPYRVTSWTHLLNSWAPNRIGDYSPPTTRFMECEQEVAAGEPTTSGNCIVGGRTGYSVKIVSESYLRSAQLPFGGEGVVGAIMNPPPGN